MERILVIDQDCCIDCEVRARIFPAVFRTEGEDDHGRDHHEHMSVVYNPGGALQQRRELTMDSSARRRASAGRTDSRSR